MEENKNLNENQMNEAPEVKEVIQPEEKPTAQNGINKNVLIIAIAAVLIVAIIAVALVAILGGNNDDDRDDDEKTSDSDKKNDKDDDDDLVVTEGLEFAINYDGTYTLMSLGSAGKEKMIVVPKTHKKGLVTAIAADAFKNNTTVKTVVIPDSVKVIDAPIFAGCSSLESLTIPYIARGERWFNNEYGDYVSGLSKLFGTSNSDIPESLTKVVINSGDRVEDFAFRGCSSLTSIEIPGSVTSIGDYVFDGCRSLTSITIPEGVTSIGDDAFLDCTSLTNINIPDSVTSIGKWAFYNCDSLTNINIPNSVTSIGSGAFSYCLSLTSITIPEGVTSIGSGAFHWCASLTNIKVDENNTAFKSIDGNLYSKDGKTLIHYTLGKQDAEFVIPEGVTSIGPGAFYWCTSLTSITISDSVTSIGSYAFDYCISLTNINIPDSVTSICEFAFYNCDSLTDVYYTGSKVEWNEISIGDYNDNLTSATIHYNYVP